MKQSAGKATTPVGDQRVAVPKKLRKKHLRLKNLKTQEKKNNG